MSWFDFGGFDLIFKVIVLTYLFLKVTQVGNVQVGEHDNYAFLKSSFSSNLHRYIIGMSQGRIW